jgi:transcriptional regulator with XRE-family HTH domain
MEIGQKIREMRIAKGLKQYQLANLAYLAPESMNRIENGLYYPSRKVIKLIADALGCKFTELHIKK